MQHPGPFTERQRAGLAINAASETVGCAFQSAEIALAAGAAPEWIHLIPAGKFNGITPKYGTHELRDAEAVIRASMSAGRELPIDYDHATDLAAPQGRPAPAAGWIKALESRADGLWGRVDWTERGREAVAGREYRHISPVYVFDQATGVVGRLVRAALTNNPNLTILQAINSGINSGQPMNELLKRLLAALGLAEGSTEDQALSAVQSAVAGVAAVRGHLKLPGSADGPAMVTAIQAAAAPDPAKFVPVEQVVALQARLTAVETRQADDLAVQAVDAAIKDGKLVPALRDWGLALHKADAGKFTTFVAGAPVVVQPGQAVRAGPAAGAAGGADRALDQDDLAVCSALGLDPAAYKATLAKETRA